MFVLSTKTKSTGLTQPRKRRKMLGRATHPRCEAGQRAAAYTQTKRRDSERANLALLVLSDNTQENLLPLTRTSSHDGSRDSGLSKLCQNGPNTTRQSRHTAVYISIQVHAKNDTLVSARSHTCTSSSVHYYVLVTFWRHGDVSWVSSLEAALMVDIHLQQVDAWLPS